MAQALRLALASGLLSMVWMVSGCGRDAPQPAGPPKSPSEAALRLFALDDGEEPDRATLETVLDADALGEDPVDALEVLDLLRGVEDVRVVREEPLVGLQRHVIDLDASLPGGGSATFSVHVTRLPDGTWRVVSFHGPGVDWPRRHPGGGPGLTVSAPPD